MRSGNGRMNAGNLSEELHRDYIPSAKYGKVYPLIYEVGACPNCYAAFLWNDFADIKKTEIADKMFDHSEKRKQACNTIFPYFDLKNERTLFDGAAMYYLALMTYDDADVDTGSVLRVIPTSAAIPRRANILATTRRVLPNRSVASLSSSSRTA